MSVVNFDFRNQVIKHNASLSYCYQCATCSGGCPVALLTEGLYNPRKIIEEAILGLQEKLVNEQDPNPWLCSTCQKCVELCPQKVELTEIFTLIKNTCFERGKCPESFYAQARVIFENGIAIPYSKAIITRREKLGLSTINTAPIKEIQSILRETHLEKNMTRGAQ